MLIAIAVVSFLGLLDAGYLVLKNLQKKPVICPLKQNCAAVLASTYSQIFGVKNEYLGALFFIAMFMMSLGEILLGLTLLPLMFLAAIPAALFSLILLGIQIFALRAYCSWCIASSLLTTTLLVLVAAALLLT